MADHKGISLQPDIMIPGNAATFLRAGNSAFAQMVDCIDKARYEIHLQTYIFVNDETGALIHQALLRAAHRGVKVFLLLDAYGSLELMRNNPWKTAWQTAGIRFRWFGRPFTGENLNIGRRLHQKVLLIDGQTAIVGGFNIANRYNDMPGLPAWLDFGLLVEGPVCMQLRKLVLQIWRTDGHAPEDNPVWGSLTPKGEVPVQIIRNDWLRGVYEISAAYREALQKAQEHVIIVGAYFTPGRRIRNSLQQAVSNGVKVQLILSQHTDVWIAKYATRYLYHWLLRNNIEIYEWPVTVVHGKVAVIDKHWATVGSYNLNFLSAYESIELNFLLEHPKTATSIHDSLANIIAKECTPFKWEDFTREHHLWNQIKEWIAYRLFRAMTRILLLVGGRGTNNRF